MVWAFILGRMEDLTRENTKMTKSMDSEFISGQMAESTLDTGVVANSTDSALTTSHNNL